MAALALAACAEPAAPPRAPGGAPFVETEAAYGTFHSKRLRLSVALPDGKAWRIDDHSRPWLAARHDPTDTELSVGRVDVHELTSRDVCLERARRDGSVPADLAVVEEARAEAPSGWDGVVLVGVRPRGGQGGAHEGHALLVAGHLRSCLFVHARTVARDEAVLSERLALLRARTLDRVRLDETRTAYDAKAPEESRAPAPRTPAR